MLIKHKGKLYVTCVGSVMVYGSETQAMTAEQNGRLERTEMRMVRDRLPSAELRERIGIESVSEDVKRNKLRWLGHVLRKDHDWVKKIMSIEVEGKRGRGRPRIKWSHVVERDMRECGLKMEDAKERERWRRLLCRAAGQPLSKHGKRP